MKAYQIYSRETGQIFAFAANLEKAQQIQADIILRDFERWEKETFPKLKEAMEKSFAHQAASNGFTFSGNVENPANTLQKFIELRLNPNKYNEDGEICSCENSLVCDCVYKCRDSVDIIEINIRE